MTCCFNLSVKISLRTCFVFKSSMRFVLFTNTVLAVILNIGAAEFDKPYSVPEPKIEVFPRGFRVSIPHEDGIHLFAFHGNINRPMDGLEAGYFSKDILRKSGDQWVFEDRHTKLNKEDVIYFWLFIIRDNLGFRYDDGRFIVKDIVDRVPIATDKDTATEATLYQESNKTISAPDNIPVNEDPRCNIVLNLTETVVYLTNDVKVLREDLKILTEIAERDPKSSRILKFSGTLPPLDDPLVTAQSIIREKLGMTFVVAKASKNTDGSITFAVETLSDKIALIKAAKIKLLNSNIILTY